MAGRLQGITQRVGSWLPWIKNSNASASAGTFDKSLYQALKRDGMDAIEAGKIAANEKKGGGLISGTAKLLLGAVGLDAVTNGGLTNWLSNRGQKIAGNWEQTQATLENLNMQTQGINLWTKILSIINAIFPTEFITKMIDDRNKKVVEINTRLQREKLGAYGVNDKGLVNSLASGLTQTAPADLALGAVVGASAISKAMTGSWNPLGIVTAPFSYLKNKFTGGADGGGGGSNGDHTPPGGNTPNGPKDPGNGGGSTTVKSTRVSETGFDASKKAASGATIETAENAVKHSRGGKLGLAAAAGIGSLGIYETIIKPTSAGAAELDQPTTAPATPAVPKLSTSENIMLGAMTGEAAYGLSKGASLVAKEGLGFAGKRIPIVGGVLTMAFTTVASAGYALNGEFGRAGAELATGTVEAALNTTGLGLLGAGDAAREALRSGISTVAGEGYAPDKSGLRTVYEYATGTGDFNAAAAPAQTASVTQLKDAVAGSEIQTADVGLDGLSSSFTSSAMMPVAASPQSIANVDMGGMDKKRKPKHGSLDATIG